ncbi:hypothetical protein P5V15_000589 [Pogonomyrmex californicus]
MKRIRRSPSSSSRSEARSSDIAEVCSSRRRLSKLFIIDITFYSRRAAAARRPDRASVVSRNGGCGEKEKEEKKTDGRDTSCMSESFGCVSARPGVRTSKCKRACAERVERKTRKRRG